MTSASLAKLLPKPREQGRPYRVAVVCLGNICRSPIGAVVLAEKLERAGMGGQVQVVSAGTGGWHVGSPMDRRAATVLTAHGYDASVHRAQQFEATWLDECDLVLAMDSSNHAEILAVAPGGDAARVRMFRDFDPLAHGSSPGDLEVPDPYYGGDAGFESVLATVERTATELVRALEDGLGRGRDGD